MPYAEGNRWRGVVRYLGTRETKLYDTKKDASKWERDRREELAKILSQTQKGTVLLVLTTKYLNHAKASFISKTYSEKKSICSRIMEAWGALTPVDEITPGNVVDFLSLRGDNNNSYNKDRKNLKALWQFGQDILDIQSNPLAKIKKRPHNEKSQYTPPVKDVLAIYAICTPEEMVFLNAYLQTAGRRSEIFRWTWSDDVNFQQRQVRLGTRKTSDGSMSYEWLPMSDDLYDSLWWWWQNKERIYAERLKKKYPKTYAKLKDNPYVFPSREGKPHKERRHFLDKLCRRAKVPEFGYHALRRHVASVLADVHKVSMKSIQQILRHKKVSTTEKYVKTINQGLEETINLLSKNHAGKEKTHYETHENKEGLEKTL